MTLMTMIPELITPFNAALFHLILIGKPSSFGFLPIGLFRTWSGLPSPCCMFERNFYDDDECTPFEKFMIRDSGFRFVLHYELALVACCVLGMSKQVKPKRDAALRRFHQMLVSASFLTLIVMSCLQYFGSEPRLEQSFFGGTVLYNLLAILTSAWAIQKLQDTNPTYSNGNESWSIPGCALMAGAVSIGVVMDMLPLDTSP